MDLQLIEKLMRMLEQSNLAELDVEEGGMRIRLAKGRRTEAGTTSPNTAPAAEVEPPAAAHPVSALGPHYIVAGMAGTFYRAPAPGAPPFVSEGTVVEDGQQLAIIEAMKMLNPVEADRAGIIRRILLADADSVAPGMALFEIEPK